MNQQQLLGVLNPYKGQVQKLVSDQSTNDIIKAIEQAHYQHSNEYKKIAQYFKGSTNRQTAQNIFNFLKENIVYKIEPGDRQTVKSPSALLAHGFGDCKHYAKFIAGILQQLNIPFVYRFASYKYGEKTPGHVFVVMNPGKKEVWIDPVLPSLDYRKNYYSKIDKQMSLYSISGIGNPKKAAKKAAGKTLGQKLKKGTKIVAKVAAAPARAAFLLLVGLNFANLAVKLSKGWQKAPSKISNFWEGIGGKMDALKKAFDKGKNKKRIFGFEQQIGVVGTAAAAAATAAPIIIKVVNVLKEMGIEPEELVEIGKNAVNDKVQQLVKEKFVQPVQKEAANIEEAAIFEDTIAPAPGTKQDGKNVLNDGKMMFPLIAGGLIIGYLLLKKK